MTNFSQLLEIIFFLKMYKSYHKPLFFRTNFLLQISSAFIMKVPHFRNEKSKINFVQMAA